MKLDDIFFFLIAWDSYSISLYTDIRLNIFTLHFSYM